LAEISACAVQALREVLTGRLWDTPEFRLRAAVT
jgi:hypothetical protein